MNVFRDVFCLLVAAAGWYYMFYSPGATNLQGIEAVNLNRRRQRYRQVGGFVMVLLGAAMFAGFHTVDAATSAQAFLLVWMSVFVLLLIVVLLAMIDLRLTWRLRQRRRE
jgi:drug/metabolite transporter (DMT)-like permease